ncbi:MAG: hypothetical protein ABIH03_00805 [Pseudomonadota bacterium]
MDNLSIFGGSMLVTPPVLLGRQLRHFSLYHALMLSVAGSPFIGVGDGQAALDDLLFAVWICCQEYDPTPAPHESPALIDEAREWGAGAGEIDLAEGCAAFTAYLNGYFAFPQFWQDGKSKPSGVPWFFRCAADVMMHYPQLSEETVWNMPINRAAAYRACVAEDNGRALFSDAEAAALRKLDADA